MTHLRSVVVFASALSLVGTTCGEGTRPPSELVDGSLAQRPRVTLEGVDRPAVVAVTRVFETGRSGDASVRSCLDEEWSEHPSGRAVLRVGVEGESVTVGGPGRRGIRACDGSPSSRLGRRWCGLSYGRRVDRRLLDPRLDLGGCSTRDGRPIAFAWVEAGPATRYVVVHHSSFVEVYEVASGLPVRVTTTEKVDLEGSRATFEVSEHSWSGRRLADYELDARTAG